MNEMQAPQELILRGDDGLGIYGIRWPRPPQAPAAKAIVVIAHGMGEHIRRYDRVAAQLSAAGYQVYGKDHRGHGRTADPLAPGDMGEDGWSKCITDMRNLVELAQREHPRLPTVLLGHSMGAMLAQQFIYRHGYLLDAVALSGSPGFGQPIMTLISVGIAQFERLRLGGGNPSPVLQKLVFGKANDAFDNPSATGFEWLTRDATEMQRYVDDELCGFVLCTASLARLFNGAREATRPGNLRTVPADLPLYVFSGSDDPVHDEQKNLDRMLSAYRAAGLKPVTRIYPGGRHELFNETNRDEVVSDLIGWLDSAAAAAS
jgi:alpha-beta hydrolase superfamily lysophospholipase